MKQFINYLIFILKFETKVKFITVFVERA